MVRVIVERRRRGLIGKFFLLLFILFNVLMAAWLFSYWSELAHAPAEISDAARAGALIGGTMGSGLIVFFWLAGAVILGLFAILTRGRREMIEEER